MKWYILDITYAKHLFAPTAHMVSNPQYDRLDEAVKAKEREITAVKARQRRLEEFTKALETAGEEFTEGLWGSLVEKVTVFKDGVLFVFTLNSGEEIRVAPC